MLPCPTMMRLALAVGLAGLIALASTPALAQFKNAQFGFEAGFLYYGTTNSERFAAVDNGGPLVGLRTAWKLTDNIWLTNRAAFAWRDQVEVVDQTIYALHLVPVAARYYFLTRRVRPFLGVTNSFQLFMNGGAGTFFWGPGGSGGIELRLRRDMFVGLQTDVFHMWGDGEFPVASVSLQLNLFL